MRVRIDCGEWYPVYSIDREGLSEENLKVNPWMEKYLIDVDDALIEKYDRIMKEFDELQKTLEGKVRWGGMGCRYHRIT